MITKKIVVKLAHRGKTTQVILKKKNVIQAIMSLQTKTKR